MRAGVIGIGNMGSGLAKNLALNGLEGWGWDIDPARMEAQRAAGRPCAMSVAELGRNVDAAFVMVMNGDQAREVILGPGGLTESMAPGGTVILSATIKPREARAIGAEVAQTGLHFIDTPVSGGFPGAQNGTLTMMAAGTDAALEAARPAMAAVSANIHRVGTQPGEGQTVKACLQSLIGAIFSATFEAAALAAKAGVPGQVIHDVFTTSAAGCGISKTSLENIIDRRFEGTGSHISTMHKDLTISLDLGQELGVPLHTAATAFQIFQAGKSKYPEGDNWVCTRVLEEIVGAELHREGAK